MSASRAAPWRRNSATASADAEPVKDGKASTCGQPSAKAPEFLAKLSTTAKEFVPSFLLKASTPEFVPAQAPMTQPSDGNCYFISLDGYSDDSEDDRPIQRSDSAQPVPMVATPTPTVPEKSATQAPPWKRVAPWKRPAAVQEEEDKDSATSPSPRLASTLSVASTTGSPTRLNEMSSTSSGTCSSKSLLEEQDFQECEAEASSSDDLEATFSMQDFLRLRHSVSWLEGIEDRLGSEKHPLAWKEEPVIQASPSKKPSQAARELPKAAFPREPPREPSWRDAPADEAPRSSLFQKKLPVGRGSVVGQQAFGQTREEEPLPLKVSDSSWLSRQLARRSEKSGEVEMSDEDVTRKMKSILNKLTVDKFPRLSRQLISCGIRTHLHVETLIQEIFDKATTQHHFINMYADLCTLLQTHFDENPIAAAPKLNFKKLLLNACQASFEKHLTPPAALQKLDGEGLAEAELIYKMRMIGNIRFVGALLVRKMLASKVMFAIIEELLGDPTPEALESLASLLTVVGPTFDVAEFPHFVMLSAIFNQIQDLSTKPEIKSRVRCLLKDVLDLRAASWKDRKPVKIEGPLTLEQVAQKFHAEAAAGDKTPSRGGDSRRFSAALPRESPTARAATSSRLSSIISGSKGSAAKPEFFPRTKSAPESNGAREDPNLSATEGKLNRLHSLRFEPNGSASCKSQSHQALNTQKQAGDDRCDKEAIRKQLIAALKELSMSHDVKEAVARVIAVSAPVSQQPEELCALLQRIVEEERSEGGRKVGFELIVNLFSQGHWKPSVLSQGLQSFQDMCEDIKLDVPALPMILREELLPALEPLVESGLLAAKQLESLVA